MTHRLVERDLWILDALARMRFLTTSLIAKLFFGGSRTAANKCLRRSFDAGLIRTWVRDLAKDNVYALTPAGRDVQDAGADSDNGALPCPRRLDGQLDHLLAVNAVRVSFAVSLADGVIAWWRSDWELRRFARTEAVPDARFALRWPDVGERVFALEVEYSTRTPRKFLKKMLRYAGPSRAFGDTDQDNILVVGRHPFWLERYRQAVAALAIGRRTWFATLADIEQHGPGAAIWRGIGDDARVFLRGLTKRPSGSADSRAENADTSRRSPLRAAQIYPSESGNNWSEQ